MKEAQLTFNSHISGRYSQIGRPTIRQKQSTKSEIKKCSQVSVCSQPRYTRRPSFESIFYKRRISCSLLGYSKLNLVLNSTRTTVGFCERRFSPRANHESDVGEGEHDKGQPLGDALLAPFRYSTRTGTGTRTIPESNIALVGCGQITKWQVYLTGTSVPTSSRLPTRATPTLTIAPSSHAMLFCFPRRNSTSDIRVAWCHLPPLLPLPAARPSPQLFKPQNTRCSPRTHDALACFVVGHLFFLNLVSIEFHANSRQKSNKSLRRYHNHPPSEYAYSLSHRPITRPPKNLVKIRSTNRRPRLS